MKLPEKIEEEHEIIWYGRKWVKHIEPLTRAEEKINEVLDYLSSLKKK